MEETAQADELTQGARHGKAQNRLDGVVIGVLVALDHGKVPLVAFAGNRRDEAIPARSTAKLSAADIGTDVALLFENGDAASPVVIGRIQRPGDQEPARGPGVVETEIDGERLVFEAKREILLKCGKASITLTRAGKVIIRGAYVLSRSSGVNRIKGGSIQLN